MYIVWSFFLQFMHLITNLKVHTRFFFFHFKRLKGKCSNFAWTTNEKKKNCDFHLSLSHFVWYDLLNACIHNYCYYIKLFIVGPCLGRCFSQLESQVYFGIVGWWSGSFNFFLFFFISFIQSPFACILKHTRTHLQSLRFFAVRPVNVIGFLFFRSFRAKNRFHWQDARDWRKRTMIFFRVISLKVSINYSNVFAMYPHTNSFIPLATKMNEYQPKKCVYTYRASVCVWN